MNDRYSKMDEFIKYASNIVKENPNLDLDSKDFHVLIYDQLVRIGTTDREADFSKSKVFDRLLKYFSDRRNISCFIDPTWSYFLQFQNKTEEAYSNSDAIKIYVPQKSSSIERSARLLFDFMDKLNIAHMSKIAKRERVDNIVIRVYNQVDADKILNFVSGNSQIQSGLINANPFTYSVNNIALGFDRDNSYNGIITCMINTYLRHLKVNNNLEMASLEDFVNYASMYYVHHFSNLKDLGEVITDFRLEGCEVNNTYNNKQIVCVGNVLHLFIRGLQKEFNLSEFYRSFNYVNNEAHIISAASEIERNRNNMEDYKSSNHLGAIDALLLESIDIFKEKYNITEKEALDLVSRYMNSNDINLITREKDMRNKYLKNNMKDKLKRLLSINQCSLEEYYKAKLASRSKNALNDAIFETYSKFETRYEQGFEDNDGITQAANALFEYINKGKTAGFTRDYNSRSNLIKYVTNDLALKQLDNYEFEDAKDNKFNLFNRCNDYVKDVVSERRKQQSKVFRL